MKRTAESVELAEPAAATALPVGPLLLPEGPPPGWRGAPGQAATDSPPWGLVLLGRYIRRSRYLINRSQQRLSLDSGVSQSMISRLELARAPGVRVDRLVPLAEHLGRAFPLGFCPHEHRCAWQPIRPPPPVDEERERMRELLIQHGLDSPFRRPFSLRD